MGQNSTVSSVFRILAYLACSHCIVIVLTDENCRKVPQLGQVKGLVHLKRQYQSLFLIKKWYSLD